MEHVFACVGLVCVACASPAPPPAVPDTGSLDATLAGYSARAVPPARSRELQLLVAPRTIRAPARPEPRPMPRGRRIDVQFADAGLGQALALLADAGHFNLVTRDLPPGHVTLALRGVDPYEALLAICQANGAAVHTEGRVVIVTAAR